MKPTAYLYKHSGKFKIKLQISFMDKASRILIKAFTSEFDRDEKCYFIELNKINVDKLVRLGFKLDSKLQRYHVLKADKKEIAVKCERVSNLIVPQLHGVLKGFQCIGVEMIDEFKGRALLADEMGLGKTVQILAWLQLYKKRRPVIIVCTASLKWNWYNEINEWLRPIPEVHIISGEKNYKLPDVDIFIINYDILSSWKNKLRDIDAEVIVFDECHYLKNSTAKRTKAAALIAKNIEYKIGATGTPIENSPADLFSILHIVKPGLFVNKYEFLHSYCDPKFNGFAWEFKGSSNEVELNEILTTNVMIRRLKSDVLKELPEKTFSIIPLDIDNKSLYNLAVNDFLQYMSNKFDSEMAITQEKVKAEFEKFAKKHGIVSTFEIDSDSIELLKQQKLTKSINGAAFVQIEALKQIAVQGKLKQVINWIRDFIESGEKLVVMTVHTFVIDALMQEFGKIAVKVDGSVSSKKRIEVVEQFQNSKKIKLFFGNIRAAGEGLNLTAACNIAVVEFPWNPSKLNQAIDRVHRIKQLRGVTVYFPIAKDTIEEKIISLIDFKSNVSAKIIDGKPLNRDSMINELLKSIKNKIS